MAYSYIEAESFPEAERPYARALFEISDGLDRAHGNLDTAQRVIQEERAPRYNPVTITPTFRGKFTQFSFGGGDRVPPDRVRLAAAEDTKDRVYYTLRTMQPREILEAAREALGKVSAPLEDLAWGLGRQLDATGSALRNRSRSI